MRRCLHKTFTSSWRVVHHRQKRRCQACISLKNMKMALDEAAKIQQTNKKNKGRWSEKWEEEKLRCRSAEACPTFTHTELGGT